MLQRAGIPLDACGRSVLCHPSVLSCGPTLKKGFGNVKHHSINKELKNVKCDQTV